MGKIWFPGGGGGADLDAVTAGAGDVLAGKVIVGADGEPLTGTLALSGTAADSQVLSGQTYYNTDAKTKRAGTMTNRGAWNGSAAMNGSVIIPAGYHNGSGKVTGPTITNRGAYGGTGNSRGNDAGNSRVWVKIPGGYYNENANVYISYADLRNMLGVTADKIKKNVSILGLIGSFEGYVTSPLYLFKDGTWSGLQTTGITEVYRTMGVNNNVDADFEIAEGRTLSIHCSWTTHVSGTAGSGIFIARLKQAVNLSAYKTLSWYGYMVSEKVNSTYYMGVSTNPQLQSLSFAASVSHTHNTTGYDSTGDVTKSIDVSSLSGNYYIYFCANATNSKTTSGLDHLTSFQVRQIYLT